MFPTAATKRLLAGYDYPPFNSVDPGGVWFFTDSASVIVKCDVIVDAIDSLQWSQERWAASSIVSKTALSSCTTVPKGAM